MSTNSTLPSTLPFWELVYVCFFLETHDDEGISHVITIYDRIFGWFLLICCIHFFLSSSLVSRWCRGWNVLELNVTRGITAAFDLHGEDELSNW